MPLIQGQEISTLISLFENRCAFFYHACQLKDFKTYLKLGGVPSRNRMQKSNLPFTAFDSDSVDLSNNVWGKVFGNLEDFGVGFALGKKNVNTAAIPIPYGPIQLIFKARAFAQASDIAICLRSASGQGFVRESEALPSVNDVDKIFTYSLSDERNNYEKAYIKRSNELKKVFNLNNYKTLNPEVSMTIQNEVLDFSQIDKVLVDDYTVNGKTLLSEVTALLQEHRVTYSRVSIRRYHKEEGEDRKKILAELVNFGLTEKHTYSQFKGITNLSGYTIDWLNRIEKGNLIYQFDRFSKYLCGGTILEM